MLRTSSRPRGKTRGRPVKNTVRVKLKDPVAWDRWCDDFYVRHGRDAYWHEIILAVQANAQGRREPKPLTEKQLAGLSQLYGDALRAWRPKKREGG